MFCIAFVKHLANDVIFATLMVEVIAHVAQQTRQYHRDHVTHTPLDYRFDY